METARRALRDLGYVEGRNLALEYRYAEGRPERLPDLAADLVRIQPDVVFAIGGDVTPAAVKATQTIPIVFTSSADPVQLGFVASLARPGRNATGVTFLLDELASKRLEILKQAAPRMSRVGFRGIRITLTMSSLKPNGRLPVWAWSSSRSRCAARRISTLPSRQRPKRASMRSTSSRRG
jgi:ABC transporter substrate binding protein